MNRYVYRVIAAIFVLILLVSCQTTVPDNEQPRGVVPNIQTDSPYQPWYLSKPFARPRRWSDDMMLEYQDYKIQFPASYSHQQDGVEIVIDFFQEYYGMGELIQAKISITNYSSNEWVTYAYDFGGLPYKNLPGLFVCGNGKTMSAVQIWHLSGMIENDGLPLPDVVMEHTCSAGETHVLECTYIADPAFFCPEGEEQQFWFCAGIADEGMLPIEIRIPIQVIKQ